jgi:hypothetical protein
MPTYDGISYEEIQEKNNDEKIYNEIWDKCVIKHNRSSVYNIYDYNDYVVQKCVKDKFIALKRLFF